MRHDRNYRRVLRSHEEYVARYKLWGIFVMLIWFVKMVATEVSDKKHDQRLNSKLKDFKKEDDEDFGI
jgi:hypothetical protein